MSYGFASSPGVRASDTINGQIGAGREQAAITIIVTETPGAAGSAAREALGGQRHPFPALPREAGNPADPSSVASACPVSSRVMPSDAPIGQGSTRCIPRRSRTPRRSKSVKRRRSARSSSGFAIAIALSPWLTDTGATPRRMPEEHEDQHADRPDGEKIGRVGEGGDGEEEEDAEDGILPQRHPVARGVVTACPRAAPTLSIGGTNEGEGGCTRAMNGYSAMSPDVSPDCLHITHVGG